MRYFETEEEARLETSKLIQGLGNEASWELNIWQPGKAYNASISNNLIEIYESGGRVYAELLGHWERRNCNEEGYALEFSPAVGIGMNASEALISWHNKTKEFVDQVSRELKTISELLRNTEK